MAGCIERCGCTANLLAGSSSCCYVHSMCEQLSSSLWSSGEGCAQCPPPSPPPPLHMRCPRRCLLAFDCSSSSSSSSSSRGRIGCLGVCREAGSSRTPHTAPHEVHVGQPSQPAWPLAAQCLLPRHSPSPGAWPQASLGGLGAAWPNLLTACVQQSTSQHRWRGCQWPRCGDSHVRRVEACVRLQVWCG
jgi:hypothetical protein